MAPHYIRQGERLIPDTLKPLAVSIDTLMPYEKNPRNGDLEAIKESLEANTQYRPVVVNVRDNRILCGNHTYAAAMELGWKEIAATFVDVDDDAAARIVLVDNRTNDLSWNDDALIAELLNELPSLEGTGYTDEALDEMVAKLDEPLNLDGISEKRQTLSERFGVPPFSVLDARQGYWQDRKRSWIALGIQSELGRGEATTPGSVGDRDAGRPPGQYSGGHAWTGNGGSEQAHSHYKGQQYTTTRRGQGKAIDQLLVNSRKKPDARTKGSGGPGDMDEQRKAWRTELATSYSSQNRLTALQKTGDSRVGKIISNTSSSANSMEYAGVEASGAAGQSGTSIFDPVLCELAYRWFCPPSGVVLDPFAGGSVRGIVAAKLGREYIGIDLRPEQVEANEYQAREIVPDAGPCWHLGDSRHILKLIGDEKADFVFTCPPYYDLEVYSDEPGDLSRAGDYAEFLSAYREIIHKSCSALKDDRFAAVVVGDIRDKKGFYRNFVSDTISAFEDAGTRLYNEAILVTAVGSLPIRVGRPFEAARKLGKTHQNVLVFVKGDPRKATEAVGSVEFGEASEDLASTA